MRCTRALLVAAFVGLLSACAGTTVKLAGSPQVPAAEGTVAIKSGENNNTRLKIDVHHLAPPERVSPGATALVVWASPMAAGGTPQNIGALRVNDKLDGELDTVTPLREFELLITAESFATVQAPSGPRLLSAHIIRR